MNRQIIVIDEDHPQILVTTDPPNAVPLKHIMSTANHTVQWFLDDYDTFADPKYFRKCCYDWGLYNVQTVCTKPRTSCDLLFSAAIENDLQLNIAQSLYWYLLND